MRHCWFSLLVFILFSQPIAAKEVIRIANGGWAPYTGEDLPDKGIFSYIVTEAFRRAGLEVEYEFFPWTRAYHYAKTGERDGTIPWKWAKERAQFFYFSEPIMSYSYNFYHLKEKTIQWEQLSDLKMYSIAATKGYNYGEDFHKAEREKIINVSRLVFELPDMLKLLINKRMDIIVASHHVAEFALYRNFTKEERALVTFDPKVLDTGGLRVLLSIKIPENKTRIKLLDEQIIKMRQQGEIKEIVQKKLRGEFHIKH
ncbi:substrate-binding periplasmic protein [Algicola sagamiensis]|uniref:substrate-binding periplasmic protein n=1 Tax=Algicola sagamiensis TaxID=163869 RepID=UPI0003809987|nr:transporter substrate-binding domain-containing protein [Algicola sagamiensis]